MAGKDYSIIKTAFSCMKKKTSLVLVQSGSKKGKKR